MNEPWRKPPRKKYVPRAAAITSSMMSKVRNRDSKAEIHLRQELWRRGFRYRLHSKSLFGKPDLVFPKFRTAVFVDGDFWHGRALIVGGVKALRVGLRTKRSSWWIAKISRTVERDREVTKVLRKLGWKVIRVWESEVLGDVLKVADRIEMHLK